MSFNDTGIVLIFVYFAVILILSLKSPKSVPGKLAFLLRAFFPSWKFFEDCEYAPLLFYRVKEKNQEFEPWAPCLEKPKFQLSSLLLNPHGNFLLLSSSLILQLVGDLEEADERFANDLEKSVAYQLTKNLVSYQIKKTRVEQRDIKYQFKLCATYPATPLRAPEDMLISPVYEA